jgi:HAD superfamily hydrolase (TIGR01549 family)
MALELGALPFVTRSSRATRGIWRALRAFRCVREELRHLGAPEVSLATLQYAEAARRAGEDQAYLERVVTEWIYQRPLKYLRLCKRSGLDGFLTFLDRRDIRVGMFSDYPVDDKLQALGLAGRMSLTLCATDPAINAFKPHPKGFLHACALWGVSPQEVLYVGDRLEVDALGAAQAGMACALLGQGNSRWASRHTAVRSVVSSSFKGLQYALTAHC